MRKKIKYILVFAALCLLFVRAHTVPVSAQIGDMGLFGGISEGRRLPRTSEQILVQNSRSNRNNKTTLKYTELIFLNGRPVQFDGLIDITVSGSVPSGAASGTAGTFTVAFTVYPTTGSTATTKINRTAVFTVTYRVEGSQVIYNYDIVKTNWRETIVTPDKTFTLDNRLSSYSASIIEDQTAGVSYYRGDISGQLMYNTADAASSTTVDQTGSFYGYSCAWSSTETHRMDVTVMNNDWSLQYQIRPSITVNKVLQYTRNEPTAISFEGNYKEVLQNISGLKYDFLLKPTFIWDEPNNGTASITSLNTFEQLPAPDITFLKGNAAEDDIGKLFAMQVLTGDPQYYKPSQAITRGQFLTALARAVKLPIEETTTATKATSKKQPAIAYLYADVDSARPEYPYIKAISDAGIAYGRDDGMFYFDYPIERQEAYVTLIRALGLTQLGMNPTPVTRFTDDKQVASWAKREVAVADMLGLIAPDASGNINPTRYITKGEAAALLNTLIEYMRSGLVSDYGERIVNIAR